MTGAALSERIAKRVRGKSQGSVRDASGWRLTGG